MKKQKKTWCRCNGDMDDVTRIRNPNTFLSQSLAFVLNVIEIWKFQSIFLKYFNFQTENHLSNLHRMYDF